MTIAVYQAGYAILGIGFDLDAAVLAANADLSEATSVEEIECAYGSEVHGQVYYARISTALAKEVAEKGGSVLYVRLPLENILVTEEEYYEYLEY